MASQRQRRRAISQATLARLYAHPLWEREWDQMRPVGREFGSPDFLRLEGLESVRAMAEDVLGNVEAANEWLNTKAMGLEFRKPIDLASTSPGAETVKSLLQRMKYGVYV